jgi:hypothetical protein
MDKLEEYIKKNREDLDRYKPSTEIWKKVRSSLHKEKIPALRWVSYAAIVVIISGTTLFLLRPGNSGLIIKKNVNTETDLTISNSNFRETEVYYAKMVNVLYREVTPLLSSEPELKEELNTDISQIDSICIDIKKDLKDNIANKEVIEALIQNYRKKIELLEEMIEILQEAENETEKNRSYEL